MHMTSTPKQAEVRERPVRIQRKRTRGWKMPENTVYVGRPGPFGNPFFSRPGEKRSHSFEAWLFRRWIYKAMEITPLEKKTAAELADFCERMATPNDETLNSRLAERLKQALPLLRGKNLACWCPLDRPCHADTLLDLANRP
jgi:Domain of unknown function (DUF4326)